MSETVFQIAPRDAKPNTGHVTTSSPRVAYAAYVAGSIVTPSPCDVVKPEDVTAERAYNPDPFALVGPYRSGGAAGRDLLKTLARDLYEIHLQTGISLDEWESARAFVERFYGPIIKNGA